MHWILIAIVVIALLLAAWRDMRMGLGLLAAVALAAIAFYFFSVGTDFFKREGALSDGDVTVEDTRAEHVYATSYRLTSRISNASESTSVREMLMRIRALDCASSDTADEACTIVAETTARERIEIPPGQSRDVQTVVSPPAFEFKGTARWRVSFDEIRTR